MFFLFLFFIFGKVTVVPYVAIGLKLFGAVHCKLNAISWIENCTTDTMSYALVIS